MKDVVKTDEDAEKNDAIAAQNERVIMRSYPNGLTVKELKEAIKNWPEINEYTGEECEVWLPTGDGTTSMAVGIWPLNKRVDDDGKVSADILFETNAFDV
jgi:hypothetical protein